MLQILIKSIKNHSPKLSCKIYWLSYDFNKFWENYPISCLFSYGIYLPIYCILYPISQSIFYRITLPVKDFEPMKYLIQDPLINQRRIIHLWVNQESFKKETYFYFSLRPTFKHNNHNKVFCFDEIERALNVGIERSNQIFSAPPILVSKGAWSNCSFRVRQSKMERRPCAVPIRKWDSFWDENLKSRFPKINVRWGPIYISHRWR